MTQAALPLVRVRRVFVAAVSSRLLLWVVFILAHLWLGYLNFYGPGYALGDVTVVYKFWMQQAVYAHYWVGIDSAWVYPIGALAPMLAAAFFGFNLYGSTWLSMVMVLNSLALLALTGTRRSRVLLGWWWVAFLLLLGPIALGRIDSITVPIALIGVLQLAKFPRVAAVLLAVATWIKVWPAAIIGAVLIASRDRVRTIVAVVGTSLVVVAVAVALGGAQNVLSFVTQQTGRGLQVEAPVTTFWMWQAWAGTPGYGVYYDQDILTYQVTGAGTDVAAGLMTPLLVLVVALIAGLGLLALRRGATTDALLGPLALALVVSLIAFNKVGSPQFMSWLCVPILLGLVTRRYGNGPSFRTPAVIALILAGLTQLIYPTFYDYVLGLNTVMLIVLTARNILTFFLLAWAIGALWRLTRVSLDEGSRTANTVLAAPASGS